jgi:enamine deaminase RidA (YjgF/YER057c/UK114 family)
MPIEIHNPETLAERKGLYSLMTRVRGGDLIFLCGITADDNALDDFERQCQDVYRKIGEALATVGAGYGNIVQFTTYLTDSADIPGFREFRKREFPLLFANEVYPPNTLLVVSALVDKKYRIEVQTVAAL